MWVGGGGCSELGAGDARVGELVFAIAAFRRGVGVVRRAVLPSQAPNGGGRIADNRRRNHLEPGRGPGVGGPQFGHKSTDERASAYQQGASSSVVVRATRCGSVAAVLVDAGEVMRGQKDAEGRHLDLIFSFYRSFGSGSVSISLA